MTLRDRLRFFLAFLVDLGRCGLCGRRMITHRDREIEKLKKTICAQATLLAAHKKR